MHPLVKSLPLTGLMLLAVMQHGCKSEANLADRSPQPMNVDGHTTTGELLPRFVERNTHLQVGFANDERFLYLRLIAPDRETQMKMLISGFEVWMDPTGKKKKTIGITYPIARQRGTESGGGFAGMPPGSRPEGAMNPEAMRKLFLENQPEVKLTGFPHLNNGLVPLQNDQQVQVAINWDPGNVMVYEAAIPLSGIWGKSYDLSQSLTLGIQLVVTGLPMPQMPGGMPGGGMPGGGMPGGGMPGGGMPGGGMPGVGGMDMQSLFESGTGFYLVQLVK